MKQALHEVSLLLRQCSLIGISCASGAWYFTVAKLLVVAGVIAVLAVVLQPTMRRSIEWEHTRLTYLGLGFRHVEHGRAKHTAYDLRWLLHNFPPRPDRNPGRF